MNWIDYYMGLAFAASKKSPDEQTQCGCFLTDRHNRPLGFGYNGFPRSAKNDSILPTTRPDKYSWMFHAEENAVANAKLDLTDAVAYVTSECCNHCLYTLWQHGIQTVYIAKAKTSHMINEEDTFWREEFKAETGIEIIYVTPNLSWLAALGAEVNEEGFFRK